MFHPVKSRGVCSPFPSRDGWHSSNRAELTALAWLPRQRLSKEDQLHHKLNSSGIDVLFDPAGPSLVCFFAYRTPPIITTSREPQRCKAPVANMGGSNQPYMYEPVLKDDERFPVPVFDPKAVTRASYEKKKPKPKPNGPLVSINRHPEYATPHLFLHFCIPVLCRNQVLTLTIVPMSSRQAGPTLGPWVPRPRAGSRG